MIKRLYLDDVRTILDTGWIIVRSYDEFTQFISKNGIPELISYDHDLMFEHIEYYNNNIMNDINHSINYDSFKYETGYDCAVWLIEYCLDNNIKMKCDTFIHSQNPAGAANIKSLIDNFYKFQKLDKSCTYYQWKFKV